MLGWDIGQDSIGLWFPVILKVLRSDLQPTPLVQQALNLDQRSFRMNSLVGRVFAVSSKHIDEGKCNAGDKQRAGGPQTSYTCSCFLYYWLAIQTCDLIKTGNQTCPVLVCGTQNKEKRATHTEEIRKSGQSWLLNMCRKVTGPYIFHRIRKASWVRLRLWLCFKQKTAVETKHEPVLKQLSHIHSSKYCSKDTYGWQVDLSKGSVTHSDTWENWPGWDHMLWTRWQNGSFPLCLL